MNLNAFYVVQKKHIQMKPISTSCIKKEYKKNVPVLNINNNKTIQQ